MGSNGFIKFNRDQITIVAGLYLWYPFSDLRSLTSDLWFLFSDPFSLISVLWSLFSDLFSLFSDLWYMISHIWSVISHLVYLISDLWSLISISDLWYLDSLLCLCFLLSKVPNLFMLTLSMLTYSLYLLQNIFRRQSSDLFRIVSGFYSSLRHHVQALSWNRQVIIPLLV